MKIKDLCKLMDETEKVKNKVCEVASNYDGYKNRCLSESLSNADLWTIASSLLYFNRIVENLNVDCFDSDGGY